LITVFIIWTISVS